MSTIKRRGRVLLLMTFVPASLGLNPGVAQAGGLTCFGLEASSPSMLGDGSDNVLEGTADNVTIEVIIGGGGNDTINGLGGNDQICGDDDSNTMSGNDTIYGGADADVIAPGGGDDDIFGGELNQPDDNISDQITYFTANTPEGMHFDVALGDAYDKALGTPYGSDDFSGIEIISGTQYDDEMIGSDATDDYFSGAGGDDHIEGKGGIDFLSYQLSPVGVRVLLEGGTAYGNGEDTFSSVEYVSGSDGPDLLVGSEANNVMLGGEGDDVIYGRGGNDPIVGEGGDDYLYGGVGEIDWTVYEDKPTEPVDVNFTTGLATRSDGTDHIFGFELAGGSQEADTLTGNNGANFFIADDGDDIIDGGGGEDMIAYFRATGGIEADLGAGGKNVSGTGTGEDKVKNMEGMTGTAYDDVLRGTSGPNYINGLDGDDKIFSEGGADYLIAGKGADKIDGGSGPEDLLDFVNATQKVTANLQAGVASGEGGDTLDGLEELGGSLQGDVLRGDGAANKLLGNNGKDKLFGRGGNDALSGQDGNDQIDGAAGKDVCKEKSESKGCEVYKLPKDHPLLEVSRRYKRLEDLDRRYKRRYK